MSIGPAQVARRRPDALREATLLQGSAASLDQLCRQPFDIAVIRRLLQKNDGGDNGEHLIGTHPAVAQVAVVGVPDARMGEVGSAFVVLREGESLSGEALLEWCRPRLANYKVPRSVAFLAALPTNAAGKVVKHELRAVQAMAGA